MKKRFFAFIATVGVAFCCFGGVACGENEREITVYAPDGAPALALAERLYNDKDDDGFTYRIVDPRLIESKVSFSEQSKNADVCVLPLTSATQKLGSGAEYKLLGVVTHGNLYMISKKEKTISAENLSDLIGETVGVLQLASIPGTVFKSILSKNQIPYAELSVGEAAQADKVNLLAITGAGDVGKLTGVDTFVLAEPAVTAQTGKGFSIVGDLQVLYGGEQGYPQAVLVAKTEIIESSETQLRAFIASLQSAGAWLVGASGEQIVESVTAHLDDPHYATTLNSKLLQTETLARCGVWFESADLAKTGIETFLTVAKRVNASIIVTPENGFYYSLD